MNRISISCFITYSDFYLNSNLKNLLMSYLGKQHLSIVVFTQFRDFQIIVKLVQDYNCTIDFVRSHFLVREGVRINGQGNSNPTLSIDRIDKTSARWKRADILVFNTGHWWAHGKTARGYVCKLIYLLYVCSIQYGIFCCIFLAQSNLFFKFIIFWKQLFLASSCSVIMTSILD